MIAKDATGYNNLTLIDHSGWDENSKITLHSFKLLLDLSYSESLFTIVVSICSIWLASNQIVFKFPFDCLHSIKFNKEWSVAPTALQVFSFFSSLLSPLSQKVFAVTTFTPETTLTIRSKSCLVQNLIWLKWPIFLSFLPRCPGEAKMMREVRTIDDSSKSLESYFEAFSFTGSSTLNLEAEVETCLDRCRPVSFLSG